MSSSKLPVWLIAMMVLLSMGFVLYPQGSANAAKYCAQLEGQQPKDTLTAHFRHLISVARA